MAHEPAYLRTFRIAVVVSVALAATGCGLKKRHRCTATATYAGKSRTGRGDDFDSEDAAKKLAVADLCKEYCMMEDPDVDAAYHKARPGPPSSDPTDERLKRLSTVSSDPVRPVLEACTAKCNAAVAGSPVSQQCEYSGI